MYRTHTCGCLRACNVNQTVTLAGWVQKVRNLGAMTFIDLRDRYGITQIVVEEHSPAEARETVCRVGREWVIQVVGKVIERESFCPNSNEVLLGVYSSGIKYALNINISSNNYRINLTTNASPNPLVASNFCMVLRKYLLNTRISKIYSIDLERIVIIEFEASEKIISRF